ncbi:hypothetical protein GCM10020218_078740 [Dactylosporangium vinaceum]
MAAETERGIQIQRTRPGERGGEQLEAALEQHGHVNVPLPHRRPPAGGGFAARRVLRLASSARAPYRQLPIRPSALAPGKWCQDFEKIERLESCRYGGSSR